MDHALGDAALAEFGEIQAGAEVIALAAEDDHARRLGQLDEARVQLLDQSVVERVAFGGRFRRTWSTWPRVSTWSNGWDGEAVARMRYLRGRLV